MKLNNITLVVSINRTSLFPKTGPPIQFKYQFKDLGIPANLEHVHR